MRLLLLAVPLVALLPLRAAAQQPNILVLLADDLGVDRVAVYASHPDPGRTPVIDALAAHGVLFRNAWSNPVCSPTRADILTGRHPYRHGIGRGLPFTGATWELSPDEVSIADVIAPAYRTAYLGKWHVANSLGGGLQHPHLLGFEHFRGSMDIFPGFISDGYTNWHKVENGVASTCTRYATTETVDDALELIGAFGDDPWMLLVGFHAPHAPFHKPPPHLHSYDLPAQVQGNVPIHYKAAVEALDTEIGRLLMSMPPATLANTVVFFLGDNGTPHPAVTPPTQPNKVKPTVYEGGVNVPLIVAGAGVAVGATCDALVNTSDLFATIAELTGHAQSTGADSISFAPQLALPSQPGARATLYTEIFVPNGLGPYTSRQRAARDARYKLMLEYTDSWLPSTARFFDLQTDPGENVNLLPGPLTPEQGSAYLALSAALAEPPPAPWQWVNAGTAGAAGVPVLAGSGALLPGTPFSLSLTGAAPGAPAFFFMGLQNIAQPFSGGAFVPRPDFLTLAVTDPSGSAAGSALWPPGFPPGSSLLMQAWMIDPSSFYGYVGSNGLAANPP